jgi:hypothetical protein
LNAALVAASSAGDNATIAPTLRSRFGQPSSLLPIPGANELSTVEWQSAQVMPTRVSVSTPLTVVTVPFNPTTASSFNSAIVVAGLRRSIEPFWIPVTTAGGSASASTFNPTDNAVVGSTAMATTSCIFSVSLHFASSPKVSKRKICRPCATMAAWLAVVSSSEDPPHAVTIAAAATSAPVRAVCPAVRAVPLQTDGWSVDLMRALS